MMSLHRIDFAESKHQSNRNFSHGLRKAGADCQQIVLCSALALGRTVKAPGPGYNDLPDMLLFAIRKDKSSLFKSMLDDSTI